MFTLSQQRFIDIFTEECIRELQFIVDISRGRAKRRATFFEQLLGKINLGATVLSALTNFFPAASGAATAVGQVAIYVTTGLKYLYERDADCNIRNVIDSARQPELLLRLMIEGVAREAARRHEFFINYMCPPEAIDNFAMVGVARVLQYLSDHQDLEFTPENLLRGLIQGRSGAGQQGFKNNKIKTIHALIKSVSAETVYGRSAHMDIAGNYYLKTEKKANFRTTFGYVKMAKKSAHKNLPKAGVMLLRPAEITEYSYPLAPQTDELKTFLCDYHPGYVELQRADLEDYMQHLKSSAKPASLIDYYQGKGIICRADLSLLDLSGGDFHGVDFAGVNLTDAILTGANFHEAYLVGANLTGAQAEHADFSNAKLSLINAANGNFKNSNFIGAKIFYSQFAAADMSGSQFLGADWCGSDLSTIILDDGAKTKLENLTTMTHQLLDQQSLQATWLNRLEAAASQQQRQQIQTILELREHLSHEQSDMRYELAEMQNQLIKLEKGLTEEASAHAAENAHATAALQQVINDYQLQYEATRKQLAEYEQTMKLIIARSNTLEGLPQQTWEKIATLAKDFTVLKEAQTQLRTDLQANMTQLAEQFECLKQELNQLKVEVSGVIAGQAMLHSLQEAFAHRLSTLSDEQKAQVKNVEKLRKQLNSEQTATRKDLFKLLSQLQDLEQNLAHSTTSHAAELAITRDALLRQINEHQQKYEAINNHLARHNQMICDLGTRFDKQEDTQQQLSANVIELTQELTVLSQAQTRLRTDLQANINKVTQEVERLKQEQDQLRAEVSGIKREHTVFRSLQEALAHRLESLSQSQQQQVIKVDELRKHLNQEQMEVRLELAKLQNQLLEQEIKISSSASANHAALEEIYVALQQQIANSRQRYEHLNIQLIAHDQTTQKIITRLSTQEAVQQQTLTEVASLAQRLDTLNQGQAQLRTELHAHNEKFVAEIEHLAHAQAQLKAEVTAFQQAQTQLSSLQDALGQRFEALQQAQRVQVQEIDESYQRLSQEQTGIRLEISALQSQLLRLEQAFEQKVATTITAELAATRADLSQRITSCQQQYEVVSKQLAQQSQAMHNVVIRLSSQETSQQQAQQELTALAQNFGFLEQDQAQLRQAVQTNNAKFATQFEHLAQAQAQLQAEVAKIQAQQLTFGSLQDAFNLRLEGLADNQKEHVTKIDGLREQLSYQQAEISLELSKMQRQLQALSQKSTAHPAELQDACNALQQQITKYQQRYKMVSNQLTEHDQTIKGIINRLANQEGVQQQTLARIATFAQQFEAFSKEHTQLRENLQTSLQTTLRTITDNLERIEREHARLKSEVAKNREEQTALRSLQSVLQDRFGELTHTQSAQALKIDELRDNLSQQQAAIRLELFRMQRELEDIEQNLQQSPATHVQELENVRTTLLNKINQSQRCFEELSNQLAEHNQVIDNIIRRLDTQTADQQQTWEEVAKLAQGFESLSQAQTQLQTSLAAVVDEVSTIKAKQAHIQEELLAAKAERVALRSLHGVLQQRFENLTQNQRAQVQKIDELGKRLSQEQAEICSELAKVQNQLLDFEKNLEQNALVQAGELEDARFALQQQLNRYQLRFEEVNNQLAEHNQLLAQIETLTTRLDIQGNLQQQTWEKVIQLARGFEALSSSQIRLRNELQANITNATREMGKVTERIGRLEQQLAAVARPENQLSPNDIERLICKQFASILLQFNNACQPSVKKPRPLLPKDRQVNFSDIRFDSKLTDGSFGSIYQGTWGLQKVAVKLIERIATEDDSKQFIREAQIMSRLHSDYITRFYGACLEPSRFCIIMELMEKGDLEAIVANISLPERLQMARDLAKGLHYLHQKEIIHGDIKPKNVLVNRFNQAKWTDFGLSKARHASIATLVEVTSLESRWQAPESWQSRPLLTPASDVYSFGMVLWYLMTNRMPYAHLTSNMEIMGHVQRKQREELPAELPALLKGLITWCWDSNPLLRPRAIDLVESLERIELAPLSPASPQQEALAENIIAKPLVIANEIQAISLRPVSPNAETLYEEGKRAREAKNYVEAYRFFERAAAKSYPKAFYNLGLFAMEGRGGIAINKEAAIAFFETGAALNEATAIYNLAKAYKKGEGVPRNFEKAMQLFEQYLELRPQDERAKKQIASLARRLQRAAGMR